ncbi:phage tail protein [Edwardsiella piscicida]|uniref:phage tail protein n=1 Tax=Edwardsiella piscicida TaxID=1263550 RepID=UPI0009350B1E|nr:phage tail protein [Edwardsiella piscicida]EKS7779754.1 phage tail protein [Edwardsiella piscicida]ELM3737216.1 phage tail protein [Edwardsiella piscicida]
MTDEIRSPSEFAMLPAGTRVSFGPLGTAIDAGKLLQNAMSIGTTGKKGTYVEVTRLIDTEPKFMQDMGEAEDKTFIFIDAPDDTNQEAFTAAAEAKETVLMFIEFPNKRVATQELALNGWSMQSVDTPKGKVLQVEVYAKQNSVSWSRKVTVTPSGKSA